MTIEVNQLPLPRTLPANADPVQSLVVFEDTNNDNEIHVILNDAYAECTSAESWGWFLANVMHVIARDYAGSYLETRRPDGDVFAAMCNGFSQCVGWIIRQQQVAE